MERSVVRSVKFSIDQPNVIESITIQFSDGKVHQLLKVKSKFQVLEKVIERTLLDNSFQ